jgi:hypothetical protein
VRLIDHVPAELGDPNLEMLSILGMQFYVSIRTKECKLGIVVSKDLKLNDFRVQTSLAF